MRLFFSGFFRLEFFFRIGLPPMDRIFEGSLVQSSSLSPSQATPSQPRPQQLEQACSRQWPEATALLFIDPTIPLERDFARQLAGICQELRAAGQRLDVVWTASDCPQKVVLDKSQYVHAYRLSLYTFGLEQGNRK